MNVQRFTVALAAAAVLVGVGAAAAAPPTGSPPENGGLPSISGTVRQGSTLTASPGVWGGTVPITYAYQWQECDVNGTTCTSISGATKKTYVLTSAEVGRTIRIRVGAKNSDGSAQAFSLPTAEVAAPGNAPANTTPPETSGVAQEGQKVTVSNGTWTGTTPINYDYRWQRCKGSPMTCNFISGASSSSYVVVSDDVGSTLRAEVDATNSVGTSSALSGVTDTVLAAGKAPANISLPVISGDAGVGKTVTGNPGLWAGAKTYSFAWQRCNASGGGCSAIPGATKATYVVASADAGLSVRFKVTAANNTGSTDASSVAAPVSSAATGNAVDVTTLVARPDHLLISQVKFSPSPFGNPGGTLTVKVKVSLEGTDKVVKGALVYITPTPYAWASASAELPTGADGWVSVPIKTTKSLPHSGALVMQVRARGPGQSETDILGGISTRRLVQVSLK